jgi:lactoylglutathione lyase
VDDDPHEVLGSCRDAAFASTALNASKPDTVELDGTTLIRRRTPMIPARELRFAFVFDDYDAALHLFRDVLGLEPILDLDHEGGRGVILKVPSATLEVFDRRQGDHVDDVEVGRRPGERVRIAVKVGDLRDASFEVEQAGASPVANPALTPWGDHNQRFTTRDGLQLTLFEETASDP